MSTYSTEIEVALTKLFATIFTGKKVAWPNRKAPTVNNSNWLEFTIMSGNTFGQSLTHSDRVNGIVQIDCYMPKLGGESFAFEIADLLNTNLPKNGVAIAEGGSSVYINYIRQPRRSEDPNYHRMIIEVSYYAFVSR